MAHYNYGSSAGTLRRYHIAVEALRQAIRLKPDFVEAHLVLAIALEKPGRFDEARHAKLMAAELGDVTAMYELAEYYASGPVGPGRERKALMWMERAANGAQIGAMDRMADIYFDGQLGQARDPRKAEEWFRTASNARK